MAANENLAEQVQDYKRRLDAIAALGGRIWAASEGPGLGASLHLMVPLMARET